MIIDTETNKECSVYDGPLLHERFAYKFFKNRVSPTGNIIAFRAPAKVEAAGMIDMEDVLNKDYIYSEDMIHFLYEIPLLNNTFGAVSFQRLFNTQIAELLSEKYIAAPIKMKGDDIIVHKSFVQRGLEQPHGKASVSIIHVKNGAALGHTGINIRAGNEAPVFAYSTNLTNEMAKSFMSDVISLFNTLTEDIFVATSKTIS